MSSRRRLDLHKHHERSHEQNLEHTAQLSNLNNAHTQDGAGGGSKLGVMTDSIASSNNEIKNQSVLTASRLNNIQNAITQDGLGGGNKLGVMTDAINTNIISSLSKLDTIATNTANIHIDVESVNLNVDTLEAKTEAISNGQTQNGDGTGNKPGVMLDAINTNTITGNSKLDTIIANTGASSTTGLATESTLSNAEAHLGNIETAVQLLDNIVSGSEAQVDVVGALPTGSNTIGKVNIGTFDNAITVNAGTNLNTSALATESTLADAEAHLGNIETAVQLLDNAISGSEMQVDIVAPLPAGTNAIGKLSANSGVDIGDVDVLSLPALPSGSNTIGKVNIGTFDNAITVNAGTNLNTSALATQSTLADAEAHLGNIETAVQLIDDVVKAEDTAHSGGDKGIMALSVRKDTATFLAGSDSDYQPLITDANGRLHGINKTAKENGSETSYVSSQSISGSGTFTGSAIALSPNTNAIFVEHNFSHTGIRYELMASIDGTNFFGTGTVFNAGGMTPATLTGINTILGSSQFAVSHPPFIKFKFSNSDSSTQSATLSYVIQSS